MKKIILSLSAILLCAVLSFSAFAAASPYCMDKVGLLTEEECSAVEEHLSALSAELDFDIAVFTVDALDGWSAPAAAAAVYDQYGYGTGDAHSGALLLLSMEEREWGMATCGAGGYLLTDWDCDAIGDLILPDLSSGNYADAFMTFGDAVASYVRNAYTSAGGEIGDLYGYDEFTGDGYGDHSGDGVYRPERASFPTGGFFFLSLTISLIVALITTAIMKGKLKSVKQQYAAAAYIDTNSLVLTDCREIFLRSDVVRFARETNSSGRSGMSGHSAGASGRSGGKF